MRGKKGLTGGKRVEREVEKKLELTFDHQVLVGVVVLYHGCSSHRQQVEVLQSML